ncbi:MAG: hypothetical protein ABW215_12665 [Kibdelosporangium sp.]
MPAFGRITAADPAGLVPVTRVIVRDAEAIFVVTIPVVASQIAAAS